MTSRIRNTEYYAMYTCQPNKDLKTKLVYMLPILYYRFFYLPTPQQPVDFLNQFRYFSIKKIYPPVLMRLGWTHSRPNPYFKLWKCLDLMISSQARWLIDQWFYIKSDAKMRFILENCVTMGRSLQCLRELK